MEKTLLKEWEKLAQSSPKIFAQNNDQTPKFIGQKNIAVGVCQACRSTANGQKSDRWSHGRPPGSTEQLEESRTLCRSTRAVGRDFQRAELSGAVDPYGRPSSSAQRRARLCTSVDRTGRPTSGLVDYKVWQVD